MNNNITMLKSAIIGKAWANLDPNSIMPASFTLPTDMVFAKNESYLIGNLSFKTDRNLNTSSIAGETTPLSLPAGTELLYFANPKRPDRRDPDYSVSVKLPAKQAEIIISNSKAGIAAWKAAAAQVV